MPTEIQTTMIPCRITFPNLATYQYLEPYVSISAPFKACNLIEPWLTGQPSVAAADEHHINTAPQSLLESDGEDELVDEDEEFDEDAIAGGSVS
jgi:hypothetical protein